MSLLDMKGTPYFYNWEIVEEKRGACVIYKKLPDGAPLHRKIMFVVTALPSEESRVANLVTEALNFHDKWKDLAPEMLVALRALVTEFEKPEWEIFCDHSVGICACGAIRVIENAKEILIKETKTQKP